MAALIAKTLVGQGCQTWRAIRLSTTVRPFNLESVEIERRKVATEADKKKIRRVSERKRVTGFARYMDKFAKKASRAKYLTDKETIKAIQKSIESTDDKVSAKEIKKIEDGFER